MIDQKNGMDPSISIAERHPPENEVDTIVLLILPPAIVGGGEFIKIIIITLFSF